MKSKKTKGETIMFHIGKESDMRSQEELPPLKKKVTTPSLHSSNKIISDRCHSQSSSTTLISSHLNGLSFQTISFSLSFLFSSISTSAWRFSSDLAYIVLPYLHPIDIIQLGNTCREGRTCSKDQKIWRSSVTMVWPIKCNHSHNWKRVYTIRMKRIIQGKQNVCSICDCRKAFKDIKNFTNHYVKHKAIAAKEETVEKKEKEENTQQSQSPSQSSSCSSSSTLASSRKSSPRTHKCKYPHCSKVYGNKTLLRRHVEGSHTKQRRYPCNYVNCDKSFTSAFELRSHAQKHNRINTSVTEISKIYKCPFIECGKKYSKFSSLRAHARTHNNKAQESLICPYESCPSKFSYSSNGMLQRHIAEVHDSSKLRYACPYNYRESEGQGNEMICNRKYFYQSHLKQHLKRAHGIT